ncbi:hypothetical protein B0H13DRAFT_2554923 [Mycena leptocephala]|nr:hypothetical protein B0H13DRAFT_2554923 [Mycena leptocephala]
MPALPNSQYNGISIGGHNTSSLGVRQFLIGTGIGASAFVLLACVVLVYVRWMRRSTSPRCKATTPSVHLARPPAARLRPDITFPELPFAPRPRPNAVAAPPKTRVFGPICEVYRYSGHWLAGPNPSSPKQTVNKSSSLVNRPVPQRQVPQQFADQAVKQPQIETTFSPERLLALWDSAVYLHQVADDVVGAHPDALPLEDRFTQADAQISFPWVSSSNAAADFKFGLVHSIDTTPAPVVKLSPPAPEDALPTPLFNWGTISHTLEKPLRGNKLQRAPFVRSHRRNVTTNVIFPKTSPFYTPSRSAADKENVNIYASPEAVCAIV